MKFNNKSVIITGAANGIGRGLAEAYASRGAQVVLSDIDETRGEETAAALREQGFTALFVPCDVRKEEDIRHLMNEAVKQFGGIDILINNAGVSRFKSPFDLTVQDWEDVLNTNARSCFLATREAAVHIRKSGRGGAVVNLSSTRSMMSEPNSEAYAASKGAIVALTHAMAVSLGPDRIRVNCISPGWIETGSYKELRPEDHSQHPAGRVGVPSDIAKACFYLTDPENDFVTGTHLVVDGGMTRKMIYEP
ncbi:MULTISPECIES: SDR family NAD(P)-dependent oxidoreductase [Paenibacillus]|uniref:Short-chain dehydrogenase/reductase SDR n=2 Tax=Paenibacillus lactis TaxID=228574 RepID=G4HFX2_9BACL|nr:glucose 1-dehydrogenase [Paenibacillus lactis]EHB64639.1 short-chain dehydrogenase/reductase SDR [Paenibacillus lactis 154]MBP1892662.1 NAD(P)-dependent dehydrogenase (short-subunit alcohol dehydrogenase family) [Paenibacillus lactis]HAF97353.1 3-oxoacyl-ACP reductase [Paenibacillus lactis]